MANSGARHRRVPTGTRSAHRTDRSILADPRDPLPRAGIDPIRSADRALAVIGLARRDPPEPETVVLVLDHLRRGRAVLVVSGTHDPDDVLGVIDVVVEALTAGTWTSEPASPSIVVASIRPGHDADPDDGARWIGLDARTAAAGVELVAWFVIGSSVHEVGARVGAAPRW